jgi:nucleotide-binding universal stress UspA family protein
MRMAAAASGRTVAPSTSREGTVMSKIIVGVDESAGSADAITLASSLAGMTGAKLLLVNVFPYEIHPSPAVNADYERVLHDDSLKLLERLRKAQGDDSVEVKAVANTSPAHGLHGLAEELDAGLIVVGSTHTGRAGRVLPGSTAERLLHGSPCPVAVAPKNYAHRTLGAPAIVGCGYDGTPSAQHALEAAHSIAAGTGASLRVIRAFHPLATVPQRGVAMGGATYNEDLRAQASDELDAAIAGLDGDPRGERFFVVGQPGSILASATDELDLLVLGSRGYGPLHSVLVGGVAGRVVREAACPVIVLPRAAGHVEDDSLFAQAAPPVHG